MVARVVATRASSALRRIESAILVILLAAAPVTAPHPAASAMRHSAVVIENAIDRTPQLVPTQAVPLPHIDAVAQVGNIIFVGGLFETVVDRTGQTHARRNFMAFDALTGVVRPGPGFDGQIWAIEPYGDSVFVGGLFTSVDGIARNRLAKINAVTGALDPGFNARFSGGIIFDLQMWGGPNGSRPTLVVGGTLGRKLIGLDPVTGADTRYFNLGIVDAIPNAWGGVAIYSLAINPAGTKLVATGNFMTVSGQSRARLFIANLTGPVATLDPWYYPGFAKACSSTHPRRIAYLQGVDFSPDGDFFVVTATGQIPFDRPADIWPDGSATYHTVCDAAGRFNLADDQRPVWINYTGGDSMWSVAVTGAAVYVQGHFRWLDNPFGFNSQDGGGAVWRLGIGAIHPVTGEALAWNPPKPAAIGGKVFLATPSGLWIGSDSQTFGSERHHGIAFVPLPPGEGQ